MPAWQESEFLGVKLVTVSPNNTKYDLPAINGLYVCLMLTKVELKLF